MHQAGAKVNSALLKEVGSLDTIAVGPLLTDVRGIVEARSTSLTNRVGCPDAWAVVIPFRVLRGVAFGLEALALGALWQFRLWGWLSRLILLDCYLGQHC